MRLSIRSSVIVARTAVRVLCTFENSRSASIVVTGNVDKIRRSILMFASEDTTALFISMNSRLYLSSMLRIVFPSEDRHIVFTIKVT